MDSEQRAKLLASPEYVKQTVSITVNLLVAKHGREVVLGALRDVLVEAGYISKEVTP